MGKKIFKLIAIILLIFIGYFIGVFTTSFDNNLCYSNIISLIQKDIQSANSKQDQELYQQIEERLNALPLQGYESNCHTIENIYKEISP